MGIQLKDLPASEFIGIVRANDLVLLSNVLAYVRRKDRTLLRYSAVVLGGPRSIRLLARQAFKGATQHPNTMDEWDAARELIRFASTEARYHPPQNEGYEKGLEVRQLTFNGALVILVQTTWVS